MKNLPALARWNCHIVMLSCLLGMVHLQIGRLRADDDRLQAAFTAAGSNQAEMAKAIEQTPESQRAGMHFLVENMPESDLKTLSSNFLLQHVNLAYDSRESASWGKKIPDDIFFNNVLPYANVNEKRDDVRARLRKQFWPVVQDLDSISQAAAKLNREVFSQLNVKYSTQRRRADQGPLESMNSGLASCTGLSILLIDTCRACGIPARFVGTPLWSDGSGNHSWVEIWDDGWHFTGAAEPTGEELDKAWFVGRASKAAVGDPRHGIFAVSFRKTDLRFPLVWARGSGNSPEVYAEEVTDRYIKPQSLAKPGMIELQFRTLQAGQSQRCTANLILMDSSGKVVFRGQTKDESFDANDHLLTRVRPGTYQLELTTDSGVVKQTIQATKDGQLVTLQTPTTKLEDPAFAPQLNAILARHTTDKQAVDWSAILEDPLSTRELTESEASQALELLTAAHLASIRAHRAAEHECKSITMGELSMPYDFTRFGDSEKPSLVISMHGGGNAPARVNDRQWENQKSLYTLNEGIYVAPRAPTNSWNLWHESHIDAFFTRLIENMLAFENVDPNRVYITGYSAGGDGVFQLAPRMADQLAAAAMMAGHPNETKPLGLRNLPFTLHAGEKDAAYDRNKKAAEWKTLLADLRREDTFGYEHWVEIHQGKGHWMDRQDAAGIEWMLKFTRNLIPERVVWLQDDVLHDRFYWVAVNKASAQPRQKIVATRQANQIVIEHSDSLDVELLLRDDMLDLDAPIEVMSDGQSVFKGIVPRTLATMVRTLIDRGDPQAVFAASLNVSLPD